MSLVDRKEMEKGEKSESERVRESESEKMNDQYKIHTTKMSQTLSLLFHAKNKQNYLLSTVNYLKISHLRVCSLSAQA